MLQLRQLRKTALQVCESGKPVIRTNSFPPLPSSEIDRSNGHKRDKRRDPRPQPFVEIPILPPMPYPDDRGDGIDSVDIDGGNVDKHTRVCIAKSSPLPIDEISRHNEKERRRRAPDRLRLPLPGDQSPIQKPTKPEKKHSNEDADHGAVEISGDGPYSSVDENGRSVVTITI